jgi:hypothetical protein
MRRFFARHAGARMHPIFGRKPSVIRAVLYRCGDKSRPDASTRRVGALTMLSYYGVLSTRLRWNSAGLWPFGHLPDYGW